ncbi:hypothetical protein [Streptomyces kurssanovii]|uniref:Uncharacterized protein n=1 Tax=Streptomyces kurssanovii TaxID=67312 RepID=A0ABV3HXH5_9ACTN
MLSELALFAILVVGGVLLAADYRQAAERFLDFLSSLVYSRPNDVLPRGFARGFGAFAALMGTVGITALTVNAMTGH